MPLKALPLANLPNLMADCETLESDSIHQRTDSGTARAKRPHRQVRPKKGQLSTEEHVVSRCFDFSAPLPHLCPSRGIDPSSQKQRHTSNHRRLNSLKNESVTSNLPSSLSMESARIAICRRSGKIFPGTIGKNVCVPIPCAICCL